MGDAGGSIETSGTADAAAESGPPVESSGAAAERAEPAGAADPPGSAEDQGVQGKSAAAGLDGVPTREGEPTASPPVPEASTGGAPAASERPAEIAQAGEAPPAQQDAGTHQESASRVADVGAERADVTSPDTKGFEAARTTDSAAAPAEVTSVVDGGESKGGADRGQPPSDATEPTRKDAVERTASHAEPVTDANRSTGESQDGRVETGESGAREDLEPAAALDPPGEEQRGDAVDSATPTADNWAHAVTLGYLALASIIGPDAEKLDEFFEARTEIAAATDSAGVGETTIEAIQAPTKAEVDEQAREATIHAIAEDERQHPHGPEPETPEPEPESRDPRRSGPSHKRRNRH